MKVAISFVLGMIICGLILFGARTVIPTLAESDNQTGGSDNLTQSLLDLMPDIEKIYRESLYAPFEKAESKIYDEDIAEFYSELMDRTGLRPPQDGETN